MLTGFRGVKTFQGGVVALVVMLTGTDPAAAAAGPRAPPPQWSDPTAPAAQMDVWLGRLVGRYRFEGLVEVVYGGAHYPDHRCAPLPPDPAQQEGFPPPVAVPYCSDIRGVGDCIAIGAGPGVQCILDVTWTEMHDLGTHDVRGIYNLPGGAPWLSPAMVLFGLDPGESAIRYLLVDNKGLPEGGTGFISGNRATFRTSCVNAPTLFQAMWEGFSTPTYYVAGQPLHSCDRIIRIDAQPDSRVLHLSMDIEINEEAFTRFEMTLRRIE